MEGWLGLPRGLRSYAASPWTGERIVHLKARWSQGASAAQIARELGPAISRNAVLGKIHRLGIVALSPYSGGRGQRPVGKKTRRARKRGGGLHLAEERPRERRPLPAWVTAAKPYVDNPLNDADIPLPERRSFLELSNRTCRWPVGDPSNSDFFFCGAEPFRGKPYCAAHCARAYRPEADMAPRAPSRRRQGPRISAGTR